MLLGKSFSTPVTSAEALKSINADFEVGLQPILAITPELQEMINNCQFINASMLNDMMIENKKATMRYDNNKTLGVVSDSYGVVQYQHAFDFVDLLTTGELGGETPTIETAGLLNDGKRVYLSAKFPEPIRLGNNDDTIDMYVVFTTSHDGSGAVTCMITPIRVICQNTLNLAFRENSGKLSFRHTAHVMDRLDLLNKENANMAYSTLKLYNAYKNVFEQKLQELAQIKLSDKETEKVLAKTILSGESYKVYEKSNFNLDEEDIPTRGKNIILNITESAHNGVGQYKLDKGTGLWLVNGLTTYYENDFQWKNDEKQFDAQMDGSVQNKLQTLYDNLRIAV